MEQHFCTQTEAIKKLSDVIFNGGNGLLAKTSDIQARVMHLEKIDNAVHEIRADIRVLLMFQAQTETRELERQSYKTDEKWAIGTIIGLSALCLSLLGYLLL